MGTSGGVAGGGSGGSGRGGSRGAGFIKLSRGELKDVNPAESEARGAIQGLFSRLPPDYVRFISGDAGVAAAYESLHALHVMLVQERSWDTVQARFGVPGGKGCLRTLVDALCPEQGPNAVHPRLRAPLQAALNDFVMRVVGDNPVVRDTGDAAEVLAAVDPRAFQSTSTLFFGSYLAELLRQEENGLTRLARQRLAGFAEAKANQVVASFNAKFRGKAWQNVQQVGFVHLFRVMRGEPEWLSGQLRKELPDEQAALSAR